MVCCSSSVAAVMMGGDGESNVGKVCTPQGTPDPNATYKYGANNACVMTCKTGYEKKDGACVEKNPCAGLTDTSLASSVPVSCLRKLLTDEGCTSNGTIWPDDDYDGWWRQDDGAGNYGVVKSDIKFWATSTDPDRVDGCGSATPCKGLTDSSPASAIPVSCLRKILTDEGCTSSGTIWPQDGYNGWWRQDGGAGNYGTVKSDIKFWATSTDPDRVRGCGRAS